MNSKNSQTNHTSRIDPIIGLGSDGRYYLGEKIATIYLPLPIPMTYTTSPIGKDENGRTKYETFNIKGPDKIKIRLVTTGTSALKEFTLSADWSKAKILLNEINLTEGPGVHRIRLKTGTQYPIDDPWTCELLGLQDIIIKDVQLEIDQY